MSRSGLLTRREFNALATSMAVQAVVARAAQRQYAAKGGLVPFAHPGMLQSAGDLRRMRDGIRHRTQPLLQGFEKLRADPHSQLTYQSQGASAEIGRNPNVRFGAFDADSSAAYQCALMGHLTGDLAYFTLSRRILEDWAATLKRISGADAILCAALGGFKMANAAELLRYGSVKWPEENAEAFGQFLRGVFLPVIIGFAPFANGNWDTATIKTMMAIAICTNDRALFDRALVYYMHGCGDGSIEHYIYANGQCQESGRDQQHTQLGLGHMGDCCEMAWHQGLDLYGVFDNRLLLGFEYTARYILGQDVPFHPDEDRTGKYKHSVIAARSALRPNYEQIYNHYTNRRGIAVPWTRKAAEAVRPEGPGFQADATGFGTLLYTRLPGPDTAEAAEVAAVSGIYAAPIDGGIEVSWVPFAQLAPYRMVRAGQAATDGHTANSRQSSLRDLTTRAGQRYMYRVKSLHGSGAWSTIQAVAGMPAGWQTSVIGAGVDGSAFFDGRAWRLSANGSTPSYVSGGGTFFVHRSLTGLGSVAGCLSPQFASQTLHAGIALVGDSFNGTTLLLEPSDRNTTESVHWVVRVYTREGMADAVIKGEQRLQEPAVTYGRVQLPLRLRLERNGSTLRAAFSLDGNIWQHVAETSVSAGPLRGGMVLNSGLGAMATEVMFSDVDIR